MTITRISFVGLIFVAQAFCAEYRIANQSAFDTYRKSPFSPGDRILFQRGQVFNGSFAPSGSGTAAAPIVIDAYGTGNLPVIHGNKAPDTTGYATLYLHNSHYWEINNLEITNTNGSTSDQGDLRGIYVVAEDIGLMEHVYIRNCTIHDVNAMVGEKTRGGILVEVIGSVTMTRVNDLRIENNIIKNVGGVGITNNSSWDGYTADRAWTNVLISGNFIDSTGRNGMIIRNTINAVIEYNTVAYPSRASTGHAIYMFNSKGTIVQFNEAYGNTGYDTDVDRGAYDADYNCEGTIIQYNYSHHNHWAIGIMCRYNRNVIVRYNISENEKLGALFYSFADSQVDAQIYNNTFYFSAGCKADIFVKVSKNGTDPKNTVFENNIFYFEGSGDTGSSYGSSVVFENNVFYHAPALGAGAITVDPNLSSPNSGRQDIDLKDPNRLSGYRLLSSSPVLGAGLPIVNNGGRDYWGNTVDAGAPDIGAHQFTSGPTRAHAPRPVMISANQSLRVGVGLTRSTHATVIYDCAGRALREFAGHSLAAGRREAWGLSIAERKIGND